MTHFDLYTISIKPRIIFEGQEILVSQFHKTIVLLQENCHIITYQNTFRLKFVKILNFSVNL